jgi:hypothetical protein
MMGYSFVFFRYDNENEGTQQICILKSIEREITFKDKKK